MKHCNPAPVCLRRYPSDCAVAADPMATWRSIPRWTAPGSSNTNLHRTPSESTKSAYGSLAAKTNPKGDGNGYKDGHNYRIQGQFENAELACGSKEFDAPFPWATSIRNGPDPSRVRGWRNSPEAGEFLQPPRCALDRSGAVPKEAPHIRERGRTQRRKPADAGLDDWPNCGQQGTGAPPLRPRTHQQSKLSLDRNGLLMEAATVRERSCNVRSIRFQQCFSGV